MAHIIETWNIRNANQGELETTKQDMACLKIKIFALSKLKSTGTGHFQ